MEWQVQEAKQRFSELLRQAHDEGPQAVTRHGKEVAYVVDVAWYREKTGPELDLRRHLLLHGPTSDNLSELVDLARTAEPARPHDPIADLVEGPADSGGDA